MSLIPSVALAANTIYTATVTTAAKDASGNPLAAAFNWTFKTAGASEPNILVALPDGGSQPLAVGASPSNRKKTVAVSNVGTSNLTIGTASIGGDESPSRSRRTGAAARRWRLAPGAASRSRPPEARRRSRRVC